MKLLLAILCASLTACSGWVDHQQYRISSPPAGFNNQQVIKEIGYHPVQIQNGTGKTYIKKERFSKFRYPSLTSFTLSDKSIVYLFWDSGVPPFEFYSPNFGNGVSQLLDSLDKHGISKDKIQVILLNEVPK